MSSSNSCCCLWLTATSGSSSPSNTENNNNDNIFVEKERRKCQDWIWLLIYILSWTGFLYVTITAAMQGGNPYKILNGVDYQGNICGRDSAVINQPYAAWIAMPPDTSTLENELGISEGSTIVKNGTTINPFECTNCDQLLVCVQSCNQTQNDPRIMDHYDSEAFMHYCLPSDTSAIAFAYTDTFNDLNSVTARAFSDVLTAWPVIVGASLIAVLLALLYTWLSKSYANEVMLVSVLLIASGGIIGSYVLIADSSDFSGTFGASTSMLTVGIILALFTAVFLLICAAIRSQIQLAVVIVKESALSLTQIPSLMFFPAIPVLAGFLYFVFFIYTTLLIGTVWDVAYIPFPGYITSKSETMYSVTELRFSYTVQSAFEQCFAFIFFHMLWTIQIIVYFNYAVITSTTSYQYFHPFRIKTKSKSQKSKRVGRVPSREFIWEACYRVLRFNSGSIALAGLLLAVMKVVRSLIRFIEKHSRNCRSGKNSCVPLVCAQCCACSVNGCMTLVDCCLNKFNEEGFIWSAVFGDGFWTSVMHAFELLLQYANHSAVVVMVGSYIIVIGEVLICVLVTGISGVILFFAYGSSISNLAVILCFVFILCYFVASAFTSALGTTIDTTLFCFLLDNQFNGASGKMVESK